MQSDEIRRLLSRRTAATWTVPVVATRRGVTRVPKGRRYYVVPENELLPSPVA